MSEVDLSIPCPVCGVENQLKMYTYIDEIPYFGEHTQVTVSCRSCGWKQSDFIPAEEKEPSMHSLIVHNRNHLEARVVRSSSCTIRIPELDLEVSPGADSTGYVSNVEGIFERFVRIIRLVKHQSIEEEIEEEITALEKMENMLVNHEYLSPGREITLVLLDPRGHSVISHEDVVFRPLNSEEIEQLPLGPEPPVFSANPSNP